MTAIGTWFRRLLTSDEPAPWLPPADTRDFALTMFHQVRKRPGNFALSPLSIRAALEMACAGARGETASQMEAVLGPSSPDVADQNSYPMTVANSLWSQDGAPLEPAFVETIARRFHGEAHLVDFVGNSESARVRINEWVSDNTRQRIRELIAPGSVDSATRLVLANAVYYKGTWRVPFDREATWDEPFHLDGGATVNAPLMHHQLDVRYVEGQGYQAVDLPYADGTLSMLVLLPQRKNGLMALENTLTREMLDECVNRMSSGEVRIFLPRFRMMWRSDNLRQQLEALGMSLPFVPFRADFSGINGRAPADANPLYLSVVVHEATVDTNEEGTEASAATSAVMLFGASPTRAAIKIPVFRADHPFLIAIRHQKSGAFLFLGRVADPTVSA